MNRLLERFNDWANNVESYDVVFGITLISLCACSIVIQEPIYNMLLMSTVSIFIGIGTLNDKLNRLLSKYE